MIKFEPVEPANDNSSGPVWKKLIWFFGLALVSGLVVALVAYALRGLLFI